MENDTLEKFASQPNHEIKTHAVSGCEQGCLAAAEKCIEEDGNHPVDCRTEWLKCADNCKFLLSPSS